jgi:tRNA pseudouridine55 synthase
MDKIVLINKPKNITSHDVVNKLRKIYGIKKIGHAGTLDPIATGLLILGVGKATKRLSEFSGMDKEYVAELKLGITTDTQDITGKVLEEKQVSNISDQEFNKICLNFKGKIKQIPPMFSAKKRNGKTLYKLARKGITIERDPIDIEIKKLEVLEFDGINAKIIVVCSSGTYIRTLAHDIGQQLGVGAVMTGLVRTKIGEFDVKDAFEIDSLKPIENE